MVGDDQPQHRVAQELEALVGLVARVLGEQATKPVGLAIQAVLIGTVQAAFYQQIAAKLELRRARRPDLKLVVMSATLDAAPIAARGTCR